MRKGRLGMRLMKMYIFPVAKELGRKLDSSFVPESTSIVSGESDLAKRWETYWKNQQQKLSWMPPTNGIPWRAATRRAAHRRADRRCGRSPGHGPAKVIAANKSNNKLKSRNSVSGPSACSKVILKKSRQEKSVRHFVQSQFQLKARVSHENDGNRHQWHSNNFI